MAGRGFTIRGPARDGALVNDEGDLTRFVRDSFGRKSGADGNVLAARIARARLDLWRVLEVYAPRVLAEGLRRRASEARDDSNRGAVGDLRRKVAAWLDPPVPTCRWCRRPVTERHRHREPRPQAPRPAPGRAKAGEVRLKPWRAAVAAWSERRATQVRDHLAARRAWALRDRTRDAARPLQLALVVSALDAYGREGAAVAMSARRTPGEGLTLRAPFPGEARPRGLPHGGRHHVDVDRDGRVLRWTLRRVLGEDRVESVARAPRAALRVALFERGGTAHHIDRVAPVAVAWARFCLALAAAFEANGRLYLKAQGRFTPEGAVKGADLVQESAAGALRGLYDYDATKAKVSTYVVNWCRQGLSRAFGERDEVHTPGWLRDLRANLERAGVDVRAALRAVEACEAVPALAALPASTRTTLAALSSADRALLDAAPRGTVDTPLPSRLALAEELAAAVVSLAPTSPPGTWPGPKDDPVCPPDVRTAFAAGRMTLGEAWTARREAVEVALCDELLATAGPVERQEAGARAVARAAGLHVKDPPVRVARVKRAKGAPKPPRVKPPARPKGSPTAHTGAAILQALRFEEPRRHSLTAPSDEQAANPEGGAGVDPRGREPVDLADPEALALAAEEAAAEQDGLAALFAALEVLRREDPRACEVVRRHDGLEACEDGDGETFAEIGESGLAADGRRRAPIARDAARALHRAGVARLRELVAASADASQSGPLARLLAAWAGEDGAGAGDPDEDVNEELDDYEAARARRARGGVFRPIRPITVDDVAPVYVAAAPLALTPVTADDLAGMSAWAAARDKVASIAW